MYAQVLDECQDVSSVLAAGIKSPEAEDDEDTLLSELNQLLEHHGRPQQEVDQQYGNKEAGWFTVHIYTYLSIYLSLHIYLYYYYYAALFSNLLPQFTHL